MVTRSLRGSWDQLYKDKAPRPSDGVRPSDLTKGIRMQSHPFYRDVAPELGLPASTLADRVNSFPYISLRTLVECCRWPSGLTVGSPFDFPSHATPGWTHELNGVTHDGNSWYFSQRLQLWKFPFTHKLDGEFHREFPTAGIPISGYTHFGDIDFYRDFLYVSLEGHASEPDAEGHSPAGDQPGMVVVFDSNLKFVGSLGLLSAQGPSAPWCAFNPFNALLYSSTFNDAAGKLLLQVYRPSAPPFHDGLTHLGTMELFDEAGGSLSVEGLQGGVFLSQRSSLPCGRH